MPRQSSRRPAPSRAPASSQTRHASTTAMPSRTAAAPPPAAAYPQQRQPGMFAQMASTAAGVAVGSTIGHTLGAGITSMFGGSSAPAEQQPQQLQYAAPTDNYAQEQAKACDADARNFTRCLEDSNGNYQACSFYLEQLKACQSAARQY